MTKASRAMSIAVRIILFLAFVAGIVACVYLMSAGELTGRESTMLGILVTILSILASWIITHMYAASQYESAIKEVREEHRSNLRMYALKAAEKVNNLSNELNKLSIYLEEELNYTDYHTAEEELLAKEERIESAIHLTRTLKSVNDTALSDWEGVIGDELDQRREEKEEKEEQLKALIERVEAMMEDQRQGFVGTQRDAQSARHELERLKRQMRIAMFQLGDTTIPKRVRKKNPKQEITGRCPSCGGEIQYRQRPSERSFKSLACSSCGTKLISTFGESSGFVLKKREIAPLDVECPSCKQKTSVPVDTFPGSSVVTACASCKHPFRVIRTLDGHDIRDMQAAKAPVPKTMPSVSEEVIEQVKVSLPPQPWPVGTHKAVATTLGLPACVVTQAINELIRRRVCNPQVDGIVYAPSTTRNTKPNPDSTAGANAAPNTGGTY
jgi:uncharacterized membrane protein (DUF485 family)